LVEFEQVAHDVDDESAGHDHVADLLPDAHQEHGHPDERGPVGALEVLSQRLLCETLVFVGAAD